MKRITELKSSKNEKSISDKLYPPPFSYTRTYTPTDTRKTSKNAKLASSNFGNVYSFGGELPGL